MKNLITLNKFIFQENNKDQFKSLSQDFALLISSLATSFKMINNEIRKGALIDDLGYSDSENIQGERQAKLDIVANSIITNQIGNSGYIAGIVSEEMEKIYCTSDNTQKGKYILVIDPVDGSSNIEINNPTGTIFAIYHHNKAENPTEEDFLKLGREIVCSGYVLYGVSTILTLTIGNGVHVFTLDNNLGEFVLIKENIKIPPQSDFILANISRKQWFEPKLQEYIDECFKGVNGKFNRYINTRWYASLVADVHRILNRGGIFMYPQDEKKPNGHLRHLYEINPIAFLIEQAGGVAVSQNTNPLDIKPTKLHSRLDFIFGEKNMMNELQEFCNKK